MNDHDFPYVTFGLKDRLFGIDCARVNEMLVLPPLAHLPATPDYVRGVVNLRGSVIMVVDLRMMMKMPSVPHDLETLIDLLGKREQDHLNWIKELENSVKERRDFKLTTNPHACAFGKWYDSYKSDNVMMSNHLKKFDAPHKRIHALGEDVIKLAADSRHDEATAIIEHEKEETLALLVALFAEAKTLLRETSREIVIVLNHRGKTLGVSVDIISSVERLKEGSEEEIQGISGELKSGLVTKIGKTVKGEKIVMLINVDDLFLGSGLAEKLEEIGNQTLART
jgi:chemotaxis signal transduction protein